MAHFIQPGQRVVLKPNLLSPRPVSAGVTTHPEIIRQVAALCRPICGRVEVTDSPGVGTARTCASRIGLRDSDDLIVVNADDGVHLPSPEKGRQPLHLVRSLAGDTVVINLPKAKTHGQMVITAAVKNTFGAVMGLEKAQWHYRIGRDPMAFARLLLHIHQMVKPRLHILDGVIGMEGNGPGSGTLRQLGLLMASDNAHLMDLALCRLWGVEPMGVPTLRAAREIGLLPDIAQADIHGPFDECRVAPHWKTATPQVLGRLIGPSFMAPLMEKLLAARPSISAERCTMCLECCRQCAAGAMDPSSGRVVIDEAKCITCFCCQEMCPHSAIQIRTGPLARLLHLGGTQSL